MEPKEKLEWLRFISEIQRDQFNKRRANEWRIFFTVLTFYCLAAYVRFHSGASFPSNAWFSPVLWIGFIIFAGSASVALAYIHIANNTNKRIAQHAEDFIQQILNGSDPAIALFDELPDRRPVHQVFWGGGVHSYWTWKWQTFVMVIFAVVSASVINC